MKPSSPVEGFEVRVVLTKKRILRCETFGKIKWFQLPLLQTMPEDLSNLSYFQYLAKSMHQKTHCGARFFSTRTGRYQDNFSLPCGLAPRWLGWGPTRCPGPDQAFLLLCRQPPRKMQEKSFSNLRMKYATLRREKIFNEEKGRDG